MMLQAYVHPKSMGQHGGAATTQEHGTSGASAHLAQDLLALFDNNIIKNKKETLDRMFQRRRKLAEELDKQIKAQEEVNRDIQEMNMQLMESNGYGRIQQDWTSVPDPNRDPQGPDDEVLGTPNSLGVQIYPDWAASTPGVGRVYSAEQQYSSFHCVGGGPSKQEQLHEEASHSDKGLTQQATGAQRHAVLTWSPQAAAQGMAIPGAGPERAATLAEQNIAGAMASSGRAAAGGDRSQESLSPGSQAGAPKRADEPTITEAKAVSVPSQQPEHTDLDADTWRRKQDGAEKLDHQRFQNSSALEGTQIDRTGEPEDRAAGLTFVAKAVSPQAPSSLKGTQKVETQGYAGKSRQGARPRRNQIEATETRPQLQMNSHEEARGNSNAAKLGPTDHHIINVSTTQAAELLHIQSAEQYYKDQQPYILQNGANAFQPNLDHGRLGTGLLRSAQLQRNPESRGGRRMNPLNTSKNGHPKMMAKSGKSPLEQNGQDKDAAGWDQSQPGGEAPQGASGEMCLKAGEAFLKLGGPACQTRENEIQSSTSMSMTLQKKGIILDQKAERGVRNGTKQQKKTFSRKFGGKQITSDQGHDYTAIQGRTAPSAVKFNQGESNGTYSQLQDEDYPSPGTSTINRRKSGVGDRFGSFGENQEGDQSFFTHNKLASIPYGQSGLSLHGTMSDQRMVLGGGADQTAEVDSKISDGKNATQTEHQQNLKNIMPSMQVEFKQQKDTAQRNKDENSRLSQLNRGSRAGSRLQSHHQSQGIQGSALGSKLAANQVGGAHQSFERKTSKQSEANWSDGHLQQVLQTDKKRTDSPKKQERSASPRPRTGGKQFQALPLSQVKIKSRTSCLNNQDHYEEVFERVKTRNERKRLKLPASYLHQQKNFQNHLPPRNERTISFHHQLSQPVSLRNNQAVQGDDSSMDPDGVVDCQNSSSTRVDAFPLPQSRGKKPQTVHGKKPRGNVMSAEPREQGSRARRGDAGKGQRAWLQQTIDIASGDTRMATNITTGPGEPREQDAIRGGMRQAGVEGHLQSGVLTRIGNQKHPMHTKERVLSAGAPVTTGSGAGSTLIQTETHTAAQVLCSKSNRTGEMQRDGQPMSAALSMMKGQLAGPATIDATVSWQAADLAQRSSPASIIRLRKQKRHGTAETIDVSQKGRAGSPNQRLCEKLRSKNVSPSLFNTANIKTIHHRNNLGQLYLQQGYAAPRLGGAGDKLSPNLHSIQLNEIDVYNSSSELKQLNMQKQMRLLSLSREYLSKTRKNFVASAGGSRWIDGGEDPHGQGSRDGQRVSADHQLLRRKQRVLATANERSLDLKSLNMKKKLLEGMLLHQQQQFYEMQLAANHQLITRAGPRQMKSSQQPVRARGKRLATVKPGEQPNQANGVISRLNNSVCMKQSQRLEWNLTCEERQASNHTITAPAPPLNILNMREKLELDTKRDEAASRLCGEPAHGATRISGTLKAQQSSGTSLGQIALNQGLVTLPAGHSARPVFLDSNDSVGGASPGPGIAGSLKLHDAHIKVDSGQEDGIVQHGSFSKRVSMNQIESNDKEVSQIQAATEKRRASKIESGMIATAEGVRGDDDLVVMEEGPEKYATELQQETSPDFVKAPNTNIIDHQQPQPLDQPHPTESPKAKIEEAEINNPHTIADEINNEDINDRT